MNEKITLPTLTQLLSLRTGDTRKQSEDFVKELLNALSAALASGEQIKIKDFGVFKTVTVDARKSVNVSTGEDYEIPAHKKVVFVPSKEISAIINAPFEIFETVELNDEVNFDEESDSFDNTDDEGVAESSDVIAENEESDKLDEEQQSLDADVPNTDVSEEIEEYDKDEDVVYVVDPDFDNEVDVEPALDELQSAEELNEISEESVDISEESAEVSDFNSEYVPSSDVNSEDEMIVEGNPDYDAPESEEICHKNHRFAYGFLTGVAASIAVTVISIISLNYFAPQYLAYLPNNSNSEIEAVEDTIAVVEEDGQLDLSDSPVVVAVEEEDKIVKSDEPSNSAKEKDVAPTAPSDKKLYDTVSTTRYLTTMAKDHYGNYHFWPYIYKENSAILGHPNRITPGTKVVIPPLSKYGVDPNNPDDVKKAKKLGAEIYDRFPN